MTRISTGRVLAASAAISLSLGLTLAACSKNESAKPAESTTTTSTDTRATTVNQGPTVIISEFRFEPNPVEAKVGQAVAWKNEGSARHTVTHDVPDEQRLFKSDPIAPDDQFVVTFSQPGTYTYICSVHPDRMRGTINVTAG
ncbi:MAG: cupredoxin domain-containing protein [Acidimicrobiales bacterium]|nr:cupredoxin domain-containing protein [Acidimicrobiales bacterium]